MMYQQINSPITGQPACHMEIKMTNEKMKLAFERMTGAPDAWTNPSLMQARNGFVAGWEAALDEQVPVAWINPVDLKNLISGVEDMYQIFEDEVVGSIPLYAKVEF
jgi:hypothetical protein